MTLPYAALSEPESRERPGRAGAAAPPLIDEAAVRDIRAIPYLRDYGGGIYRDLDLGLTLDYMRRRFVAPLAPRIAIRDAALLDCAAGFGWLSFAYLLSGGGRAILVEMDPARLAAARQIATRLGLVERCEFRCEALQDIALADDAVDIFASIETLEHVGRANVAASLRTIARVAKTAVMLTTPNFLFPAVAHDTGLPLAHWLPPRLRHAYAAAAGRAALDHGNDFLRPWDLAPLLTKFRPAARYQTFDTLAAFDAFYPHYMPYGPDELQRHRARPKAGQRALHIALATLLGGWSFTLAPSLASLWLRRP